MSNRSTNLTVLRMLYAFASCILLAIPEIVHAEQTMLIDELHHLRSGQRREWSDFPDASEGPKLSATFKVDPAAKPQTLGLRRIDVKEDWRLSINARKLKDLASDENDMHEVWSIPADYLVDGENTIVVEAASEKLDDVRIGQLWVDTRGKDELLNECTLDLKAVDEKGESIPCRFTILKDGASLAAIAGGADRLTAIRSGVVYSGTGTAKIGIPAGNYTVYCGRGFEYGLVSQELHLQTGDTEQVQFKLIRQVDTAGYIACDTHIHTFEISRHGDATLAERMVTLAGEGIELAIATDHNIFVDYGPTQNELGLQKYFKPIIGNEVTTKFGHFNAFAGSTAATLPDHQAADWSTLMKSIRQTAGLQFVTLNHPRDLHSGFRPFGPENMIAATGRRIDGRTLEVDAMELINSAALQSDPMVLFHDWMTQVNRGYRLHAVGASDSHEVSMKIVGQGRTYIRIDDTDPTSLDWTDILAAMYGGKMLVSLGLMVEINADQDYYSGDFYSTDGDHIVIQLSVRGPAWSKAEVIELYSNGDLVKSLPLDLKYSATQPFAFGFQLDRPAHDVQLVAIARGHSSAGLAWPIAKPYQPTSTDWQPYVFGSSGIIRIDCDDDGKWTSANEYASAIIARSKGDLTSAIKDLQAYDSVVATFFADQWSQQHGNLRDESARAIWQNADAKIRDGIQAFLDSQRASVQR